MNLKPIQKKRVYQEIIEQIQTMINNGEVKPGDKLPSERELAKRLNVSRSAVREAVSVLEFIGLIEIFPGIGIFLVEDTVQTLVDRISDILNQEKINLPGLMDIRQGVEGQGAYLAALYRSKTELEAIRMAYERLQVSEGELDAHNDFHLAVAAASRNTALSKIVELLLDCSLREACRRVHDENDEILKENFDIYKAIEEQDPEKAERAMKQHLANVKRRLQKA